MYGRLLLGSKAIPPTVLKPAQRASACSLQHTSGSFRLIAAVDRLENDPKQCNINRDITCQHICAITNVEHMTRDPRSPQANAPLHSVVGGETHHISHS